MHIRSITGSASTTVERDGVEVDVEYYFTYHPPLASYDRDVQDDDAYVVILECDGAAVSLTEDEIAVLEDFHLENPPPCYIPEFDELADYSNEKDDFKL